VNLGQDRYYFFSYLYPLPDPVFQAANYPFYETVFLAIKYVVILPVLPAHSAPSGSDPSPPWNSSIWRIGDRRRDSDAPKPFSFDHDPLLVEGTRLSKSGRSTGNTSAILNTLQSVEFHRLEGKRGAEDIGLKWSNKVSTYGVGKAFAEPGDSGSWVYGPGGFLYAMVTAGDKVQGTTYVCLMEDILNDIQDITGAADVRIAPAPRS
jgi:hypothetical protein